MGVYDNRPMTAQERRFEDFVNERQALHDISNERKEWTRCRDVEEEAIVIFHEVGCDLSEFLTKMLTYDQEELEFQCQRRKEKEWKLRQGVLVREQLRMQAAAMEQAAAVAAATASTGAAAREDFKATVMRGLIANREFVPASQQVRRQEPPASNQAVPSAEPGPSSQQVQRTARSDEDVRGQFNSAVKSQRRAPSDGNGMPSSSEAGPSTNQGQQTARGQEVAPVQSNGQVQPGKRKTLIDRRVTFKKHESLWGCGSYLCCPLMTNRARFSRPWPPPPPSSKKSLIDKLFTLEEQESLWACNPARCRALIANRVHPSEPSSSSSSTNPSPRQSSSDEKSNTPPTRPPSSRQSPTNFFESVPNVNVSDSQELINTSSPGGRDEPAPPTAVHEPELGYAIYEDEDGWSVVCL